MPYRFFCFILALGAALPAQAALLDGIVEQTVDLQIPDASHQGIAGIAGMGLPLGTGDLVGQGDAADLAAVADALSKDDPKSADPKASFPGAGLRVIVRLGNGVLVVVVQPMRPRAFVGQSVRIEGSGRAARVVAAKAPPAS